jgi:cysteine synthase/rhodanese-related sulfurtransferase
MLPAVEPGVDRDLLERFEKEMWSRMPHPDDTQDGTIVNATPLVDLTEDLRECARQAYSMSLPGDLRVWGKFDSDLPTGSIKARPAAYIIHDAIRSGALRGGQIIIEATSGNFGIALGSMSGIGLKVISLVSRKLQEGVFEELRSENVHTIDLDMDICPAPGMKESAGALAAKAAAANIRAQLTKMGFDPTVFDGAYSQIEPLLAAQDIINLAKLLGRIYGMFCPEQYDNNMNIESHRTITAPEMDQQLHERGQSLGDNAVLCTFGTGGTSGGIGRYIYDKYGKKSVHVVFPPAGQDVAGIRTKDKADGLGLYRPQEYAGEHEVDFERARPLLRFLAQRGRDIGESSALALYAAMQMASSGGGGRFVVMVADGIRKYRKNLEAAASSNPRVSLEDAASAADGYDRIIWVHAQYTPRDAGVELIARSLGVDKSKISIPKASTVGRMLMTQEVPEDLKRDLQGGKGKSLLVCMAGNTSLMASKVLAKSGITAQSLNGGITNLPESKGRYPGEFIRPATE